MILMLTLLHYNNRQREDVTIFMTLSLMNSHAQVCVVVEG